MNKFQVKFLPAGNEIEVAEGTTLYEAAVALGLPIQGVCGGKGSCGRCVVKVEAGDCPSTPHKRIGPEDEARGYRLACRARVTGDLSVYIPEESLIPTADVDFGAVLLSEDEKKRERVLKTLEITPLLDRYTLDLPPPSLDDNISDLERITRSLRARGVDEEPGCSLEVLRAIPGVLRGAGWKTDVALFRNGAGAELVSVSPPGGGPRYGLAIDLGTTTVVAELVELGTGRCSHRAAAYNRQLSCGADVISRIVHAAKPGGKEHLRSLALETIQAVVGCLYERTGTGPGDVALAVIAGNTTMDHLLLDLESQQIRIEPYIPVANRYPVLRAADIGLPISPSGPVFIAPAIGSYVGGDVLAGVLACGMHRSEEITLFIDAGTNGEIVLGNRDWMMGCACSTGPAFEGIGITCGMMAAPGAVDAVKIERPGDAPAARTIAGAPARGLCGSGMIDLMAELFRHGILDRKGILDEGSGCPRLETREGHNSYIVRKDGEDGAECDVYLGDVDFKKLLLTKAAIQAAILTLVRVVELEIESVGRVVIAGRLGEAIDVDNAIGIGMLPELPRDRFKYLGNGSLWGANLLLLSRDKRREIIEIADRITYTDLSSYPGYMDEFIASLFIPHTNA